MAVNSEGKTNEATKNLKEPLRKGQTAPKDTAQQQQQLLRETDLSIGDIAQQVGYENQSKFSNVFRDIFQVLPTEYRRQQSRDSKTEGRL